MSEEGTWERPLPVRTFNRGGGDRDDSDVSEVVLRPRQAIGCELRTAGSVPRRWHRPAETIVAVQPRPFVVVLPQINLFKFP